MSKLRIIIAGSREFSDYSLLKEEVMKICMNYANYKKSDVEIISGGARGADSLGERFAKQFGIEIKQFIPDWNRLGKKAGYIRNSQMAEYSVQDNSYGVLIAFWDGESKGTKHMIDLATKQGLDTYVINYKERND